MFSTPPKTNFYFSVIFFLSSANAFNLDQSRILSFGKELSYSISFRVHISWQMNYSYVIRVVKSRDCVVKSTTQSRLSTTLYKKPFENIVGKGENAGNQHFLIFTKCFLSVPKQIPISGIYFFI